jgi:oxygen-independent coproporphyrinogen-3 oxidase
VRSVHFGIDFAAYFCDEIRELQTLAADGLVRIAHERITATSAGRLLLRNIAMCFDRYLAAPSPAAQAVPRSRAV